VKREIYERLFDMLAPSKQQLVEQNASLRTRHLTVVIENLYQSHNTSAVVRTADCFGIQDVFVIAKSVYKLNGDVAMGASKWITEHRFANENTKTCIAEVKARGYKVVATSPHAAKSIFDLDIDQSICLMFGSEKKGLSQQALELAEEHVSIPMYGFTESFNISVSAALCLQVLRQKLENSSIQWKLSEQEQIDLKIEWCRRILDRGDLVYEEVRKRIEQNTKHP
jgi:tRNA (guanosine-2'-O-)-methyltransferase